MRLHTSLRTGGVVRYLAFPENLPQVVALLEAAREKGLEAVVVGSCTNLLVSDNHFDGIVISMSHLKGITIKGDLVTAYAGESLDYVINRAIEHNLTGMEELGGIPGSVGGAVAGNAGANGREISDIFFYADCIDRKEGKLKRFPSYIDSFSYRSSSFAGDNIIITAAFRLSPSRNTASARVLKEEYRRKRVEKGQFQYPSAGCIFKNPEGSSAGALIEECSLAGRRRGGAMILPSHCNFIVNCDNATSSEILDLSREAQEEVYRCKGIMLEYEVKLIGSF